MIIEIEAKSSNLTKAELTYDPVSAKIMTTVNKPTTTGNKIVKSYNEKSSPKS